MRRCVALIFCVLLLSHETVGQACARERMKPMEVFKSILNPFVASSHNRTLVAESMRHHCSQPSTIALREVGNKILADSPFLASLKLGLTEFPHLAGASLVIANSILEHSKRSEHMERTGVVSFLEFLDDHTIIGSTQCALANAVFAWMSLVFSILFVFNNTWFFTAFLFPSEVPSAVVKNNQFGMWAFVFSTAYALSASVCLRSDLDKCSHTKVVGNIAIFPSMILLYWGMLSAAVDHEKKRTSENALPEPVKAVTMPVSPFQPYSWRLNNFASQMESGKTTEKHLDNLAEETQAPGPVAKPKPFHALSFLGTLMVFITRSYLAIIGLVATAASAMVAAFGCYSTDLSEFSR